MRDYIFFFYGSLDKMLDKQKDLHVIWNAMILM